MYVFKLKSGKYIFDIYIYIHGLVEYNGIETKRP